MTDNTKALDWQSTSLTERTRLTPPQHPANMHTQSLPRLCIMRTRQAA